MKSSQEQQQDSPTRYACIICHDDIGTAVQCPKTACRVELHRWRATGRRPPRPKSPPIRLDVPSSDFPWVIGAGAGSGRHLFWRAGPYVVHEDPGGSSWVLGADSLADLDGRGVRRPLRGVR